MNKKNPPDPFSPYMDEDKLPAHLRFARRKNGGRASLSEAVNNIMEEWAAEMKREGRDIRGRPLLEQLEETSTKH